MRIGFLASHPIQYHAPLLRALAARSELTVYFAHRQDAQSQARAGYGVAFDWDVDLLSGYQHRFLNNDARHPSVSRFFGCRSSEVALLIRDGKFDGFVVSGWNLWVYWQAIFACRRHGVKVLARGDSQLGSPRSLPLRVLKRVLYPLLFSLLDGFLAVGRRSQDYLAHYSVPRHRIFAAQHVVDRQRFADGATRSGPEHEALRSRLRLPSDRPVVMFVGRLIDWKRVDDVIGAIAITDWSVAPILLIVGDGPQRESWSEQAARSGVDVRFAGFVNQAGLPAHYALADVLVLASDGNETWGLVVNEAIASGVPVLTSDAVGSAEELAIAGETGARFPLGDRRALGIELRRIIDLGRDSFAAGLRRKANWFSPEVAADGIVAAIASLNGLKQDPHG